jgi:hypothetical protein
MVPASRKSNSAMNRQSFVPRLLVLQGAGIFLLLSCASTRPPQRLRVHVTPGFVGTLQLTPCVSGALAAEVSTDGHGVGSTSLCPSSDGSVVIVVIRGSQQYTSAAEDVTIRRTGDGIATSIDIRLRP